MKHLGLLFSTVAIPSLALLVSGCGGGTSRVSPTELIINFGNPGTQTVGAPLTLSATSNLGFPVAFASTTPGVCTVSGTTATFVAAGTCTIDASVAGNGTNTAASQVAQSFSVNPAIGSTTTIYIAGEAITSAPGATDETSAPEEWQLKSGSPTATVTSLPVPSGMTASTANAIVVSDGNVYVAGTVSDITSQMAVYWVNGVVTTLSPPSGMGNSAAAAIAVSGGNVYVAGWATSSAGIGAAVLWVNGTPTTLTPPSGMAISGADGITVSGGDVYVVGTAWNSNVDERATFWVNGTAALLPMPARSMTINYHANAIAVSGGNVYVAGSADSGAVSWENSGWATTLSLPSGWLSSSYSATGITVSGGDVYVSGGGVNNAGSMTAVYWVNGKPTALAMPSNLLNSSAGSFANGIGISGSDVYVAGYAGETAAYWVNDGAGTLLPMPGGAHKSWANAITVSTQ